MADEFVQLETKPPNLSDRVGREIQEDPRLVISRARVASTLSSPGSVPKNSRRFEYRLSNLSCTERL